MKTHDTHRWNAAELPPERRALLLVAVAWTIAWKGASLWRAAKSDSKPWFVTLLLTNTLGILDAVYLFIVARRDHVVTKS